MLTEVTIFVKIIFALDKKRETKMDVERYRSGHNEAVLKTVCPQGHVGSNPTLSAYDVSHKIQLVISYRVLVQNYLGEVPKWLKGHPWKGCRSLVAARGFKSLLLRSVFPNGANE